MGAPVVAMAKRQNREPIFDKVSGQWRSSSASSSPFALHPSLSMDTRGARHIGSRVFEGRMRITDVRLAGCIRANVTAKFGSRRSPDVRCALKTGPFLN